MRPGWKIIAPKPEEAELTERHYRIGKDLAADADAVVEVTLQRPRLTDARFRLPARALPACAAWITVIRST